MYDDEEKAESQKPVAIVQPTGPTLPRTKTKAKKKARLNGLIDRLAAKKGPTEPSKPTIPTRQNNLLSLEGADLGDLELWNDGKDLNVKGKDGIKLGKIKILQRNGQK